MNSTEKIRKGKGLGRGERKELLSRAEIHLLKYEHGKVIARTAD